MKTIKIKWLVDEYDCSHEGCSGGWAEGAKVTLNGEPFLELIPVAHCFGGDSWTNEQVFEEILKKLGYNVEYVKD